jgi:hypothetical protein
MPDMTTLLAREKRRKQIINELSTLPDPKKPVSLDEVMELASRDFWVRHINSKHPILQWLCMQMLMWQIRRARGEARPVYSYLCQRFWR